MNKYKKITTGFVVQDYEILPDGSQICQSQEFVAEDQADYEDENGEPVVINTLKEVYHPFEMVQPK